MILLKSILLFFISNAVKSLLLIFIYLFINKDFGVCRRDKSTLYSRVAIIILYTKIIKLSKKLGKVQLSNLTLFSSVLKISPMFIWFNCGSYIFNYLTLFLAIVFILTNLYNRAGLLTLLDIFINKREGLLLLFNTMWFLPHKTLLKITLIGILSVAVFYLVIVKQIFYKFDSELNDLNHTGHIFNRAGLIRNFTISNYIVKLSSSNIILTLFIFIPQEWLSMANILALIKTKNYA